MTMTFANSSSVRTRSVPASVWTGRVMSGLVCLFLAWDVWMKLTAHPMAVEGMKELGFPEHALMSTGLCGLACWVLYVIPRTAVVGCVLWTGYLGGAIAIHIQAGNPLFSHTLFPIYVAVFLWGGLALRDPRVFALLGLSARSVVAGVERTSV